MYILYTMSFIRKIKRNGKVYLAEVENKWVDGRCVQRHIRYVGKQVDGETKLATSISDAEITQVKVYGPLLVLNHLASEIGLAELLGDYGKEILSLTFAHCLDYKSINRMERWFERTDLNKLLGIENVTEKRLLNAMDYLEKVDAELLQKNIFEKVKEKYKVKGNGVVYDVTNTYFYGKKCPMAKHGKGKGGVKGRPLIQIGLGVTMQEGIPVFHKTFDGNVHDARTVQEIISMFGRFGMNHGLIVYDRGITSRRNFLDMKNLKWDTLCGIPIKGREKKLVRELIKKQCIINLDNRAKLGKTVFYVVIMPYEIYGIKGTLAICFNEQKRREIRESRYDEILYAQQLLKQKKTIKQGLRKYFYGNGELNNKAIIKAEEFDGFFCIFSTSPVTKAEFIRIYLGNKDIIEKAFKSIKGIIRLQPIRHWLYNRVTAHVFICYLAYLLLSLLKLRLKEVGISPEEALYELETMYKVYLRDPKKGFTLSRVVSLTKTQENILKTIDKNLVKS